MVFVPAAIRGSPQTVKNGGYKKFNTTVRACVIVLRALYCIQGKYQPSTQGELRYLGAGGRVS